ncbi:MAG: endonuclease/exonuclease/phosphatase family protein, partial [Bacteroidota bacterium]
QLPGEYAWPTRIFQLDRCILYQQYAVKDDRKLTLLNVHNSAYDGGVLKAQQMEYLKNLVLEEYEKGNYVIVGGDWNMCPPNFPFDSFMPGGAQGFGQINIPMDFLPVDWQWVYDPTTATNRKNATPYIKGETFITLIDFYLISPNVFVKNIKGINQEFNYSDHQPVWMEVELR